MHHLISVAGMTVAVVTGKYGTEMIATIFGSEVTNPLLQTRWFLRETGNYNTRLGTFVDITFMSMFGFFRIGIGSYLLYTYFRQDTENIGRFAALVIYGISWLFWISIMQYAFKKIRRAFSKSSSKSSETNSTKVVLNGNHNCSSNGVSSNHSAGHKVLANGSLDNKVCQDISHEIHRNGYHKISNGDISEVDKGSLRQRIPNGIIEEKVLHSTMASSQVK
ncbi:hypothetical protein FSP39_004631 [Pinctada imbricata]|uniref:TLC domain-containing protein n=1 Tax=Pinctada imbricata TaxID=66713 RepID=A0AA89C331_PINIB|nr:hypothetical protein FSP39_004631 [Pinctada imbricata]